MVIAVQRQVARSADGAIELRKVFAWLAIAPALSNFVGPVLAGLMIDAAGFRAAFLLMAALPLISWLAVRGARAMGPATPPAGTSPGGAWGLWRDPGMRRLLIITCLLSSCWDVHIFLVPVLGHERGFSASVIGSILGAFGLAAASVRVLMPLVAARLGEWAVLVGAMAATGVLFGVYPLVHSPLAMGVCSILLGLSLGSVQPMIMSMLHQLTPEHRHGQAVSMRIIVINISSVAMPIVSGAAGALVGAAGVFWAAGVVVGAGAKLALGLRR